MPEEAPLNQWVRRIRTQYFGRLTLLAVCPNSRAVTRAALKAAAEAEAPLIFAATLNQIDRDGGYTGWTPQTFTRFVRAEARRLHLRIPIVFGLDHGGPWLKDRHVLEGYTYEQACSGVVASIHDCLDAGYTHLHLDATGQPSWTSCDPLPVEIIVERTIRLMEEAERYRLAHNLPPVSYEVGTEEIQGGLTDTERFRHFLHQLDEALRQHVLQDRWPCFVVGQVGTDLHTTHFDPARARMLTQEVLPYGALLKGHYTDYVDNPEDYPLSGMGGANVGPEFTDVEYQALMELVRLARKTGFASSLPDAIRQAVLEDGRWKKWLREEERDKAFEALPSDRQDWLIRTGSRYIWSRPEVQEARMRLYDAVAPYRNGEAFVEWRIKTAILAYYHRFNLLEATYRLAGESSS